MIGVPVDWTEARYAADAGAMRHLTNLRKARAPRYGATENGWTFHIEGALGELVVAKSLGRYWSPRIGVLDYGGDVGSLQIRATARPDGRLIVHPGDPDEATFVLVRGEPPNMEIVGQIRGGDAKDPAFWFANCREPAYFIPGETLDPFDVDRWRRES